MRIIAGRFRGKRLDTPKGLGTRPTTDRVREALFNVLEHGAPEIDFEKCRVLDLFAGSGALGLEALSRGARFSLFIEEEPGARGAIRRNVEALGLTGKTKIWRRDAARLGAAGTTAPFDLVFCDPPYGTGLGIKALGNAAEGGWLAAGAIVVLEERAGELGKLAEDLGEDLEKALETALGKNLGQDLGKASFEELDRRRYGETEIAIVRFST